MKKKLGTTGTGFLVLALLLTLTGCVAGTVPGGQTDPPSGDGQETGSPLESGAPADPFADFEPTDAKTGKLPTYPVEEGDPWWEDIMAACEDGPGAGAGIRAIRRIDLGMVDQNGNALLLFAVCTGEEKEGYDLRYYVGYHRTSDEGAGEDGVISSFGEETLADAGYDYYKVMKDAADEYEKMESPLFEEK